MKMLGKHKIGLKKYISYLIADVKSKNRLNMNKTKSGILNSIFNVFLKN